MATWMVKARQLVHEYIRRDEEGNPIGAQTALDHVDMDIKEEGDAIPNTVFTCTPPVVAYTSKTVGICAIAPIIVIKNDTNDVYHGFIKLSQHYKSASDKVNLKIKCEVILIENLRKN